jgi:hypothetical protein
MPAAPYKLRRLGLVGVLLAVAVSILAAAGGVSAREEPWSDPDRVATSIEIDDDGIIIRTESKDGGDPETIEILSDGRDSDVIIRGGDCRILSKRGVKARVKWDIRDLDKLSCIDIDERDSDTVVEFCGDIHIDRWERIDGDVVAIGGSIYVAGEVDGDVVALGGSVTLDSRAEVDGDAVAVGGDLILHRGSEIDGDAISVGGEIDDAGAYVSGDTVLLDFSLW